MHLRLPSLAAAAAAIAFTLPLTTTATPARAACVTGVAKWDVLWMRTGPSVRYRRILGIGPRACGVRVYWRSCVRNGRWCKVRYAGHVGWVNMRYIDEGGDGAGALRPNACVRGVARWDVLWMRSGPSVRYRRVASLPPGYCGVIITNRCRRNWCFAYSLEGADGWVNMRYIGWK